MNGDVACVHRERERKRAREHDLALCLSTVLRVSCLQSINRILLRHLRHLSYRQDTHANVFSKHAIIQIYRHITSGSIFLH